MITNPPVNPRRNGPLGKLEILNANMIVPHSDIYDSSRLSRICRLVSEHGPDLTPGIVAKVHDDFYVELAGRYRNFATTLAGMKAAASKFVDTDEFDPI